MTPFVIKDVERLAQNKPTENGKAEKTELLFCGKEILKIENKKKEVKIIKP